MKINFINIIATSSTLLLIGCASPSVFNHNQLSMTYDTNPRGATLVCNGTNYGYTPKTLYYNVDDASRERGYSNLSGCTVTWVSGASTSFQTLRADLNTTGYSQIYTINRPNVADYAQDAQFALQVESLNYQKRQAEAAEMTAITSQQIKNNQDNAQMQQNLNNINNQLIQQQQSFQRTINNTGYIYTPSSYYKPY